MSFCLYCVKPQCRPYDLHVSLSGRRDPYRARLDATRKIELCSNAVAGWDLFKHHLDLYQMLRALKLPEIERVRSSLTAIEHGIFDTAALFDVTVTLRSIEPIGEHCSTVVVRWLVC